MSFRGLRPWYFSKLKGGGEGRGEGDKGSLEFWALHETSLKSMSLSACSEMHQCAHSRVGAEVWNWEPVIYILVLPLNLWVVLGKLFIPSASVSLSYCLHQPCCEDQSISVCIALGKLLGSIVIKSCRTFILDSKINAKKKSKWSSLHLDPKPCDMLYFLKKKKERERKKKKGSCISFTGVLLPWPSAEETEEWILWKIISQILHKTSCRLCQKCIICCR